MPRKFDLSKEECRFCHDLGHRIHQQDSTGKYVLDDHGERIVLCPVLLKKNKRHTSVEDQFPTLSGVMSEESRDADSAILTARNQEKFENWLRREKLKKERTKERAAKMLEWDKSQGVILAEKYGPRWHWQVKDTREDSEYAEGLRYHDECEQIALEYWQQTGIR